MIEKPQIGGRMLPTRWENLLRRSKGTMRSSKKISNALSMVKLHTLTEIPIIIKAWHRTNTGILLPFYVI